MSRETYSVRRRLHRDRPEVLDDTLNCYIIES